jgi:hypothetical protein
LSTTFNLFTAAAVTLGVLPLFIVLFLNMAFVWKKLLKLKMSFQMNAMLIQLLVVSLFFLPKGAVLSWYVLGMFIGSNLEKRESIIT